MPEISDLLGSPLCGPARFLFAPGHECVTHVLICPGAILFVEFSSTMVSESLDHIAEMTDTISASSLSFFRAYRGCDGRRLMLPVTGGGDEASSFHVPVIGQVLNAHQHFSFSHVFSLAAEGMLLSDR